MYAINSSSHLDLNQTLLEHNLSNPQLAGPSTSTTCSTYVKFLTADEHDHSNRDGTNNNHSGDVKEEDEYKDDDDDIGH